MSINIINPGIIILPDNNNYIFSILIFQNEDVRMDNNESESNRELFLASYKVVGVLNTNGSANNSLIYKGLRGGLFYINSNNNMSYVSSFQKEYNIKYFTS